MISMSRNNSQSGFTLLEVLISMAVLVFISFAIYQATTETYKLRDSLSIEADFYNAIRLSMSIVQRDISLIYSPIPLVPPKQNSNPNNINQPLTDDLGRSFNYWSSALTPTGIRPSHFIGTEDKISFISLSHIRIYKDSPESEFAKISYETKKDEDNKDNPNALVLVKTESPNAFVSDDIKDTLSHSYELLHGIQKISFSYYQRDGDTWKTFKTWDSDHEETKNKVPEIIEIKIDVKGPKTLNFEGKFKFRPEIPWNGLNHST